jgi:hypothetical protein
MAGLEAALDELERAPPAAPEPWEALCARAVKSLEDERGKPGAEALREAVRPLFVEAKSQACRRGRLREVFHVAAASLTEGRLLLRYDFAARDQILDFQPRGAAEAVEHRNRMLVVRGECRLLRGEPFRGRLQLKAKVPAGSYEPRAPNLAIGFFTAEQDRLRVEGGRTASLFGRLAAGGSVPRDHVVLALGYHAQVADYGGRPIYEIHAAGRTDAVRLPAHLVLAGARGKPLHEDARECLWAQPLVEDVRGALAIEAAVEGGAVTWLVGGKAILGERRHVFPELEAPPQPTGEPPPERLGSLTLLAVAGEARFTALEVEGKVNEAWLRSELERAAEAAFAGLFPLPPGEKE